MLYLLCTTLIFFFIEIILPGPSYSIYLSISVQTKMFMKSQIKKKNNT